jgi:hypothetical protein
VQIVVSARWSLPAEHIVAVGLLTEHEVGLLGHAFDRLWPIEEAPLFEGLLEAIDEADRELWRARDRASDLV